MVIPDPAEISDPVLAKFYSEMASRCLVMGILNTTPDSFSDGGVHLDRGKAVDAALAMEEQGADIIDIGGESTRPGADPVSADEEIKRVVPVIASLSRDLSIPISIDTSKAAVARAATEAGARIINDVTGLQADQELASVAAEARLPLILMHMRGTPRTMQSNTDYKNIVQDITRFFTVQAGVARQYGVLPQYLIVDPGFGFAKSPDGNLEILRRLGEFASLGHPILIGTSRKSTLGIILDGAPVDERQEATAASVAISVYNGANIVRVHDVASTVKVVKTADAILRGIT